ncbi:lytic transglycosylase domain-containing protein [Streptacidiphilus carbonis]|uniref:lytic transglycosylase domain-containing protein n=1 Tax=Streptacidiphilus carbonis TaxID=105422 RepID=UPI001F3A1C1F|nr:lytic murein transglycosylase [Streptacidiphilus carbonis]
MPTGHGAALPATVFAAYRSAQASLAVSDPGCRLRWQLLAGIGQVESDQADGGRVDATGTAYTPILGPLLDGNGTAAIRDTDHGVYDGSTVWDRAVGPMQFIPETWKTWGVDANGDGRADPENIQDAALAAGRYLCAGGRDLADPAQLDAAILGYNHSTVYLDTVKSWMAYFERGVTPVADSPAGSSGGSSPTTAPAAKPSRSSAPSAPSAPPSASPTQRALPSASPSAPRASASAAPTATAGSSPSPSVPVGPTVPAAPSSSPSVSPSASPTGCPSPSASPSRTATTAGASASPSVAPSAQASGSPAPGTTACASPSAPPSATAAPSSTPAATPTAR